MKFSLTNLMAIAKRSLLVIAFLSLAIAFTPINSALAGTVKTNAVDTAKQASEEVVKDTGAKQQFGKSANGDRLLDKAQEKASQNLNDIAEEADSGTDLPDSKKLFLKNLHNQS